ncbi:MAG: lactonase family protein, partial [Proteobacteria bacterium]|nr:lactonase family protein [Pseudomonadota bacterium]
MLLPSRSLFTFVLVLGLMMPSAIEPNTKSLAAEEISRAQKIDVWIGTSARKPSEGIYHCLLDTSNGKLSEPELAAKISGPGFLALHPDQHHLYAVGKLDGVPSVVAYRIVHEGKKNSLQLDNSLPIGDGTAAHVAVDPTGQMLLTAQYGGGSAAAFSLKPDGSLNAATELIKHEGGSRAVPGRQDAPH